MVFLYEETEPCCRIFFGTCDSGMKNIRGFAKDSIFHITGNKMREFWVAINTNFTFVHYKIFYLSTRSIRRANTHVSQQSNQKFKYQLQ